MSKPAVADDPPPIRTPGMILWTSIPRPRRWERSWCWCSLSGASRAGQPAAMRASCSRLEPPSCPLEKDQRDLQQPPSLPNLAAHLARYQRASSRRESGLAQLRRLGLAELGLEDRDRRSCPDPGREIKAPGQIRDGPRVQIADACQRLPCRSKGPPQQPPQLSTDLHLRRIKPKSRPHAASLPPQRDPA